jgi:hemoglobin
VTRQDGYAAHRTDLTEPQLREVIEAFYVKVRSDPILGPVFSDIIGDAWASHMDRIHLFWATVTRVGSGYNARNFLPAHLKHPSIKASQLPRWLELFRRTAGEQCSPADAAALIDIAERVAENIAISLGRRG